MLQHFEAEMVNDVSSKGFVGKRKEVSEHNESFVIDKLCLFADLEVIYNTKAAVDQEILHFAKICAILLQTFQHIGDGSLGCRSIIQRPLPYLLCPMGEKIEMLMMNFL